MILKTLDGKEIPKSDLQTVLNDMIRAGAEKGFMDFKESNGEYKLTFFDYDPKYKHTRGAMKISQKKLLEWILA